jgi:hypothetical protein
MILLAIFSKLFIQKVGQFCKVGAKRVSLAKMALGEKLFQSHNQAL